MPGADSSLEIVAVDDDAYGAKAFGRSQERMLRTVNVRQGQLRESLDSLRREIAELFPSSQEPSGAWGLDYIQLQVEVTTKGELRLVGAVSAEVKGGITLQFSRRS